MRVLKFQFPNHAHLRRAEITMEGGAMVLAFQCQDGRPTFWYEERSTDHPTRVRVFYLAYTGRTLDDDDSVYLGTAQMPDGIVVHLFEGKP